MSNAGLRLLCIVNREMFRLNRVTLFIAVLCWSKDVYACDELYVMKQATSFRCPVEENAIIKQLTRMSWGQCKLLCLHHRNCAVVSYDTAALQCTLLSDTCSTMIQASQDIITLFLGTSPTKCLEWRPFDALWPADLVIVNEVGAAGTNYAVGRLTTNNRMIPAKYRTGSFITTYGGRKVTAGTPEHLIIHPHCRVQWVSWSSTSGDDMPAGAIVAGHLENDIPLYIAKVWLSYVWVIGYNPETLRGHFWFVSARTATSMDILVLHWGVLKESDGEKVNWRGTLWMNQVRTSKLEQKKKNMLQLCSWSQLHTCKLLTLVGKRLR